MSKYIPSVTLAIQIIMIAGFVVWASNNNRSVKKAIG